MIGIQIALIIIGSAMFLIILKIAIDWIRICFGVSDELTKWAENIRSRKKRKQ